VNFYGVGPFLEQTKLFVPTKADKRAAAELAKMADELSGLPGHKLSAIGLLREAVRLYSIINAEQQIGAE
jgi:hypothetical protein